MFSRTLSLTARLTIAYTLSSVLLVLVATLYLYWSLVHAFDYRDEKFFASKIEAINSLLARGDGGKALRYRIGKEWPSQTSEMFYVRLANQVGTVLVETPGGDAVFHGISHPQVEVGAQGKRWKRPRTVHVDSQVFRSYDTTINHEGEIYTLRFALDRTEDNSLIREYRNRLFTVLVVCFVVGALVCFQIARRGLRPINRMAQTAANITSSNWEKRMQPEEMPSELAYLATTFDDMLDRLRSSFDRLQRFSADIAHELRTPINNISGELQVAMGKSRPAEYYRDAIGSCLEECGRISRIIDSLLFLAHAENPQMQLTRETIDLRKELIAALEFYEAAAAEKGIQCALAMVSDYSLSVERVLFQRAVGNLLSNAIKHTPAEGKIQIEVVRRGEFVVIEVVDSGIGIPEEHLPHLFDRFYRVDASRSKDSGGSGLGLAIVKSIASIHGGDVKVSSKVEAGTRFSLYFPAETPSRVEITKL